MFFPKNLNCLFTSKASISKTFFHLSYPDKFILIWMNPLSQNCCLLEAFKMKIKSSTFPGSQDCKRSRQAADQNPTDSDLVP